MDDSHCPFAVGELFYAGDDLLVGRVGEMDSPFRFVEQFFDMGQVTRFDMSPSSYSAALFI